MQHFKRGVEVPSLFFGGKALLVLIKALIIRGWKEHGGVGGSAYAVLNRRAELLLCI